MLFAATRLTLVRELGTERFRETLFATTKKELTAEGWRKHDKSGELKAPLTEEEQTLQGVKAAEAEASRGTTARSSHVSSGLSFPISDDALHALKDLSSGSDNLVQLVSFGSKLIECFMSLNMAQKINLEKEVLELVSTTSTDVESLAAAISESEPRYSFFRYSHEVEGQEQSPIVFIYTCPSGSKIKERMVYASGRAVVVNTVSQETKLEITKKV